MLKGEMSEEEQGKKKSDTDEFEEIHGLKKTEFNIRKRILEESYKQTIGHCGTS